MAIAVLLLGIVVLPTPSDALRPPASGRAGLSPAAGPRNVNYSTTTVDYRSSVDGFLLSYYETRPVPFNASRTYPIAVELHGLTGETYPYSGGVGGYVVPSTAQAAANAGLVLLDLNTRTGSGWYVNSNYTGPQEQDVLDAIANERSLRHVGAVFLFGVSMGSIGTLSIGLDHPRLFKGLGAIASFTDFFEMFAYLNQSPYASLDPFLLLPSGGAYPNASGYARRIFLHLSPLRFHPENLSGVRLYVANGARDVLASNNASLWGYQQENATLLNRTCAVASVFGEPPNCTVPLAELEALHPARYHFRYVFEPNGPHDYYLLNATDLFAYFLGHRPDGAYWGRWPVPSPTAPPTPLLTLATVPFGCGSVAIGRTSMVGGETEGFAPGNYSVNATGCGNRTLHAVRATGGVAYHPARGTVTISGSGALVATFRAPRGPSRGPGLPEAVRSWRFGRARSRCPPAPRRARPARRRRAEPRG